MSSVTRSLLNPEHVMRNLTVFLSLLVAFAILSLSESVGQLFGLEKPVSAWGILALGIVLALANIFLISRFSKTVPLKWGKAVAYLTLLSVAGWAFARARTAYVSMPPYLIESISVKTTVNDKEGTSAHLETRAQLKILRDNVVDIVWGGLGSTGVTRNVTVSAITGNFTSTAVQQAGDWQLHLKFSKPPKKGEQVAFVFAFDGVNSEPEPHTYMVHSVTWPTQNLGITLIVPRERPCRTAEAYSEDAITMEAGKHEERPPLLYGDNTELQWTIADPQEGRKYIVICRQ